MSIWDLIAGRQFSAVHIGLTRFVAVFVRSGWYVLIGGYDRDKIFIFNAWITFEGEHHDVDRVRNGSCARYPFGDNVPFPFDVFISANAMVIEDGIGRLENATLRFVVFISIDEKWFISDS